MFPLKLVWLKIEPCFVVLRLIDDDGGWFCCPEYSYVVDGSMLGKFRLVWLRPEDGWVCSYCFV